MAINTIFVTLDMDLVLVEGLASQKLVNLAQIFLFLGQDKEKKRRIDAKKSGQKNFHLTDCLIAKVIIAMLLQ